MIKYVEANAAKCGIPPQIGDQLKAGHKNTEAMQQKVCAVAAQRPTGPAGPSLSEVLGSSAALPEAHREEGRQHLRYAERQRSHAMTRAPMSDATARVADATGNWVDTRAPSWSRPYLRLSRFDRPIGSWLLLMPCWWSAALAAGIAHDARPLPLVIVLFFIGAFVMRGAGCTWNDITDRDLDAKVERTRSRPIPAGQVSVPQAFAFLVLQALIGLAVLLQFNRFAIMTGIASLVIVAVYPFMKRITWWPQVVLGLAFSWGALMGFAVILGRIDLTALVLYAGSIAWVIGYDTIYAHQDAEDDALIGIKSTARLFGAATHRALVVFYALAVVLIGAGAGAGRGAMAGMDRADRVRRASGLADPAARHQRSRAVPADLQVQPRCRAAAVCGIAGGCGDALKRSCVGWAKAHLRRAHHLSESIAATNWWARFALPTLQNQLIPRDDLAFALVKVRRVEQVAGAAAHQEFRAAGADRVVAATARGRFARLVFRQLRKREDLAPHLPGRGDLLGVGTDARAECSARDRDAPAPASARRRDRATQRRENR